MAMFRNIFEKTKSPVFQAIIAAALAAVSDPRSENERIAGTYVAENRPGIYKIEQKRVWDRGSRQNSYILTINSYVFAMVLYIPVAPVDY